MNLNSTFNNIYFKKLKHDVKINPNLIKKNKINNTYLFISKFDKNIFSRNTYVSYNQNFSNELITYIIFSNIFVGIKNIDNKWKLEDQIITKLNLFKKLKKIGIICNIENINFIYTNSEIGTRLCFLYIMIIKNKFCNYVEYLNKFTLNLDNIKLLFLPN